MPTAEPGGESFGEFVAAALPVLLRFGHVLTGNRQEAEDLVQEALAKSMRRWRRAGPAGLEPLHQEFGPPDLSRPVKSGCGKRTARATWLVVTRQLREPGLQSEFLLLDRRGHLLVWNAQ